MNRIGLFLLAVLGLSMPVLAQTVNPYNGKWKITFDGSKRADVEGAVAIVDSGGTWEVVLHSSKSPCYGREYEITVQSATDEELTFTVNRAKSLAGCKDSTYTFKKVDEKTMRGELDGGRQALLVRN